jgi:hypothetical protein
MHTSIPSRRLPAALALIAVALVGLAFAAATNAATAAGPTTSAQDNKHRSTERLVVRGTDTVSELGCSPAGVCEASLTDGEFRGTPVGSGAYDGRLELRLGEAFPNGEGGACAPISGHVTLGIGTPNRLVLAYWGDSCQDGAGDPTKSSFLNLAHFIVKKGTGTYAHAHGSGLITFAEDAADQDRMTVIGRITR